MSLVDGRDKKQPQYCLVAILEWKRSGATFGQDSWIEGWTHGWAKVPHATAHRIGVDASICKESACDASLRIPCRTTYGGRLFIIFLFYYLSTNMCLICLKG